MVKNDDFNLLDNDENSLPGSGLGLAIVHWVMESHGVKISFENSDPTGLTVSITLPICRD